MTEKAIAPPFVYFGGKRKIAAAVWGRLGDVDNYVEPFFGAGSVLLARPHDPRLETVNDMDGFVANFWRAVQADPDAVADAMNWPVSEVDLEARHRWLCRVPEKGQFLERMKHDPDYYDVQRAAWWCWGLNAWIGGGWCSGEYFPNAPQDSHGEGIRAGANKLPNLSSGRGVHRRRPHLGTSGQCVHRKLPPGYEPSRGEVENRREWLRAWMRQICDRFRHVRVCCGDWERVCTDGATAHGRTVGVCLDPPYAHAANRDPAIYRCDDATVADRVRAWCVSRTNHPRFRIALAGYDGEHNDLERMGWRVLAWRAYGGMANFSSREQGRINKHRERVWFSPSCQPVGQQDLFTPRGSPH